MSRKQPFARLTAVLLFAAGALVPLAAFLLGVRREFQIAWLFLRHEARFSWWLLATVLPLLALIPFLRWLLSARGIVVLAIGQLSEQLKFSGRTIAVVSLLVLLPLVAAHLRLRYRYFSEVYYPQRALKYVQEDDFLRGRLVCEEYVRLYPQRRASGSYPDSVCVPLLRLTTGSADLKRYIEANPPRELRVPGVPPRADWQLRAEALSLLDMLSGGDVGTASRPRASKPDSE